jgi:hypothetical protein
VTMPARPAHHAGGDLSPEGSSPTTWHRGRTVLGQFGLLTCVWLAAFLVYVRDFTCSFGENARPSTFCDAERTFAGGGFFVLITLGAAMLASIGCVISQVKRRWMPALLGVTVGLGIGVSCAVWAFSA